MSVQRAKNHQGLNLPITQHSNLPTNVQHQTVIIPSTSACAFGSYCVFDFKEKSLLLHEITLQFNVSTLSCTPAADNTATNPFWITAYH